MLPVTNDARRRQKRLWDDCNDHCLFGEYSKGRNKFIDKLTSKMWKSLVQDFVEFKKRDAVKEETKFKLETFPAECTRQDTLRNALRDQNSGTYDEKGSSSAI